MKRARRNYIKPVMYAVVFLSFNIEIYLDSIYKLTASRSSRKAAIYAMHFAINQQVPIPRV